MLGRAHAALSEAASRATEESAGREYFNLFGGLGQSSISPYSSYYLTGSLYGRPLSRLRECLRLLGIQSSASHSEPEDHAATLCEVMSLLADGSAATPIGADRDFFKEHLAPWISEVLVDLEHTPSIGFYTSVGALGRTFVDIENEGFALSG